MHRVTRLIGVAYTGLWLLWSTWIAFGPDGLIEAARRRPALQIEGLLESLAWLLLTPLVGLLVSFWLVRRSRFWGAAVALVFCVLFTFAARIGVDVVMEPVDSCFCSPNTERPVRITACSLPITQRAKPLAPFAGVPRSRGFQSTAEAEAARARHSR